MLRGRPLRFMRKTTVTEHNKVFARANAPIAAARTNPARQQKENIAQITLTLALALGSVWSLQAKAEPSETRSQIDDTTSTGNRKKRERKRESWVNSRRALQTSAHSW
ncbi:hypothetical protein DPX16_7401 [Anabarilius grahami]|uniref:Uncharacterized protein n=1 Tax=Anabarilius grahami TaxID=495550 RepID=A0A3N0Z2B1_ANAGA|nr:hypothetical protein DPX16_7401 [Anabarilius grahami]